jgi:capsular polysaccharide biosynthesis protein
MVTDGNEELQRRGGVERRPALALAAPVQRPGVLTVLSRRWWIVACVTLIVFALSWALSNHVTKRYEARAIYSVPVLNPPQIPGSPGDAARLAQNYAALLPEDDAFAVRLSSDSGVSADAIQDGLRVSTVPSSSLLTVSWTSSNRAEVGRFFDALSRALESPSAPSANIQPFTLRLVHGASSAGEVTNVARQAGLFGLVMGLILGLVAALVAERSDPRLDDEATVDAYLGVPAFELRGSGPAGAAALVNDWRRSSGRSDPVVSFVTPSARYQPHLLAAVTQLGDLVEEAGDTVIVARSIGDAAEPSQALGERPVTFAVGGVLGRSGVAERVAQESDLTVVVVPRHVRLKLVVSAVRSLARFGRAPRWLVIAPRPSRRSRQRASARTRPPGTSDAAAAGDSQPR